MNNKKIIVFGGCSVDYTYNQKANGSYDDFESEVAFGGKGANQAVAASRAGADVSIITRLGGKGDKERQIAGSIIKNFKNNNVNTEYIEVLEDVVNDTSKIKVSLSGENDISRITGAIDSFTVDMIEKYGNVLKNADYVIAQAKVPKEVTKALINFCYENDVFLVLTPCRPLKLRGDIELINKINLITCNYDECCKMFGDENKDENNVDKYTLSDEKMKDVLKRYPNKLVVTLGAGGVIYFDGKTFVKIPSLKIDNVVDTTGAGDTLNGNLVASLSEGKSLSESINDGILAATYKIQYNCAQEGMPTKSQREKFKKIIESK